MCSYWVSFFIIDFIKLLIFNALLLLPILIISRLGLYFFLCMPMMNISSLVFIYFFSSFCRNEKEGIKIIPYSISIPLLIIIAFYIILLPFKDESKFIEGYFYNFISKRYIYSLWDLTPIFSLAIAIYRIIRSNGVYELGYIEEDKYYKPISYVITGQITQFVNFIIYFSLFLLNEKGYLAKLYMKIKTNSLFNYVFSEESVPEDFYDNNNLRNPKSGQQNINQNISNNNMINNININNNNINNNNLINNQNTQDNINVIPFMM